MTQDEKQKALNLEVGQGMFQKFKDDYIGIPNQSDAVYYTQAESDAYNAELTGALDSTTPLTAEQAAAYNAAVTGATKEAGDTLSSAEANAYNATLEGAVSTSDIKTPAVPTKVKDYVDNMTGDRDIADAAGLYSQGKLTLEKNIVNGVNILTQSMFYKEDTENPGEYIPKFTDTEVVIKYDFYINEDSFDNDSSDKSITLPEGTVLKFEGGCIHIAEENGSRPFYYIDAGIGKKCRIIEDGHMILDYVPVGTRLTNDYINASSIGVCTANKTDNAARINRFFRRRGGGLRFDEPCMWVGGATPDTNCYSIEMPIRMPYNGGKITGIGCIADVGSILVPTADFLTNYPNRGVIETSNYWKGLTTVADEEMESAAAYAFAHGIEISNLQVRGMDRADFGIVIWCCGEDAKIERLHVSTSNKAAIFFGGLSAVARARLCFTSNLNSAGCGYLYDNHPDANYAPGISAASGGRGSGGSASLVECSGDCYNWVKANGSLALDIVAPKIEFCANAIVSEHTGTGNVAQQINMTGGRIQFTQGDKYILKAYSAAACHCTIQNMTAYAHAKTAYYTSTSTSVAKLRDDTIGFWSNDTINAPIPISVSPQDLGFGIAFCTTDATTAAKEVSITSFVLTQHATITVMFFKGIEVATPTLNVNNTGAKQIRFIDTTTNGTGLSFAPIPPGLIKAGTIVTLTYWNSAWIVTNIFGYESIKPDTELWVDLGLPSGVKWAKYNIDVSQTNKFAANIEDYGSYFSYGNIDGHYNGDGFKFGNSANDGSATVKYNTTPGYLCNTNIPAMSSYDTARVLCGSPWRMPSDVEFSELINNCDLTWTQQNNVNGMLFTSKSDNTKSIFLPAGGQCRRVYEQVGTQGLYRTSRNVYVCQLTSSQHTVVVGSAFPGQLIRPVM